MSRRRWAIVGAVILAWAALAYLVAPLAWRRYAHRDPALEDVPTLTHTASGIPGDPLNVALVATEEDLHRAMHAAGWFPADRITFDSSVRIVADTVLHRQYEDAPVSSLYLFGRKQDLAYEQPVGDDPKERHHVRFWRRPKPYDDGRPFWIGSATFDVQVGLSHTTGQVTHHIAPDVDADRDRLLADLRRAGELQAEYWVDGFQTVREGRNGGGDPYRTDGRLGVGVLRVLGPALPGRPGA